jgi:hypothetical protein
MNATPPTPTPKPKKTPAPAAPLPEGVVLGDGFTPRIDQPATTKQGAARRRVLLEVAESNVDGVVARLAPRMQAAGFTVGKPAARPDGTHLLRFRKPGYGDVLATIDTSPTRPLRAAGAHALLRLDWPA